ncbi:MAG: hypothetical protein L6R41_002962 [Letrouitia leprolyta]|nr:MAG: hypothetical protein L6R41_002962 [Letrouitia leprolyta]
MGRSRVMSLMSVFSTPKFQSPQSQSPVNPSPQPQEVHSSSSPSHWAQPATDSPTPRQRTRAATASSSRPMSMVQTYQPPLMEIGQDVIPELQPIFSFLNSHSNKLYQEGYFLKLNDLDSHGRPNTDRSWTECFAQLVGTILSLWDAAELDAAGHDGEVAPRFINLADASIKMIETLPTRAQGAQPLHNVLSVSTAGKNRYLFHFNSFHSLTQWTAGIRLAMFENTTLQEAYTGSLIAGKGKLLNNIKVIMERIRFKHEDWARVRFGAGTPWRRCWCVISPPDEKEVQQQQKALKKKSAYDRVAPILKGNIKFYDTRKIKKGTRPIATINDAFSAYAIYPQSKPLIDQSTLVKVEGIITIHSSPETTTEGFVFVMPEAHAAVTGFEMMLRWLVPLYDVYGLYGRPNRLIADVSDVRSLMFALPQTRRYGYLDILDVAQLINEPGSQSWSEKDWRSRLKELTASRQTMYQANGGRPKSRASSYRGHRNSLPSRSGTIRFDDSASVKSAQSMRGDVPPMPPPHTDSAPPGSGPFGLPRTKSHQRSVSEATAFSTPPRKQRSQRYAQDGHGYTPSRLSEEQSRPYTQDGQYNASRSQVSFEQPRPNGSGESVPPMPPTHGVPVTAQARNPQLQRYVAEQNGFQERHSSESEGRTQTPTSVASLPIDQGLRPSSPPKPVAAPPAFIHEPGAKPQKRPALSPEMRRATSRMSVTTLAQLADAGQLSPNGSLAAAGAAAAWNAEGQRVNGRTSEDQGHRGVIDNATSSRTNADHYANLQGMVLADGGRTSSDPNIPRHFAAAVNNYSGGQTPYGVSDQPPTRPDFPAHRMDHDVPPHTRHSVHGAIPEAYQQHPGVTNDPRPDIKRSSTSHSITRKPVPSRSPARDPPPPLPVQPPSPSRRSSLESLRQHVVDEDALAQVRSYTMESNQSHQPSVDESIYDDDSTASPDYASTRRSTETRRSKPSMDRPRVGVLKTVGTVEPEAKEVVVGDARYQPGLSDPEISAAIPSVDFGPTLAYDPRKSSRPGTSGTMTPQMNDSASPSDRLTPSPQPSPRQGSPGDQTRRESIPTNKLAYGPYERSPSRNLHTPEGHHRTPSTGSEADNSRTIAWQPAAVGGSPGSRQSITPEQFVQQRATASRVTPIYAHGRKQPGGPSPSGSRHPSGEVPVQLHSRQASFTKDLPPRPSSRGASVMMNSPADVSAHLSAREQEHVARVTGSPLINMAANSPRPGQGPPGGGLVGAIEAREKEKREIREGVSSHMVQHAIAQRQQHNQAQQQQQQQRQQSFPQPSPQMPMPGAFPQTPQYQMPGAFPTTPQFPPTPGQGQSPYVWGQQQQLQYGQQYPQQRPQPQQWVSQAQRMYWGAPQQGAPYQQRMQQYQHGNLQQQAQMQYGQGQQQMQIDYNQGQQQQQYNGPYFGNGQGGRQ